MTLLESPGELDGGERGRRGVFYGWRLVALIAGVMVLSTVPTFRAMAVWMLALEHHFGWTRTHLSLAFTLTRFWAPMSLVQGYLADKVGARRMALTGLCILGGAFFVLSMTQNLWMFYVAFALMGVGAFLADWIPLMTMLCRWFVRRRALAIGIVNMASPAWAIVLVPLIAWAIDRIGWRVIAMALGLLILIVAIAVYAWLRNRPEDMGLMPDGGSPASESATQPASLSTGQTLRTRAFWFIVFGAVLAAVSVLSATEFLWGEMSDELGFSSTSSLTFYTVYVSVKLVFYLVGGFAGDRFPKFAVLAFFTAVGAAGMALLGFANGFPALCVAAAALGIGVGGLAPVTIAIIADYFGMEHFGRILGVFTFLTLLPLAVGEALVAAFLDWYGGELLNAYRIVFLIQAGCGLLAAWCFLKARPPQAPNTVAPQTAADQQTDG